MLRKILSQVFVRNSSVFNVYNVFVRSRATATADLNSQIALSKDKRTIICWHPEKAFPYECSLPLPVKAAPLDNSVLKVQSTAALRAIHRPKPDVIQRQELMNITYTTKHLWFPNNRRLRQKKVEPKRPYL